MPIHDTCSLPNYNDTLTARSEGTCTLSTPDIFYVHDMLQGTCVPPCLYTLCVPQVVGFIKVRCETFKNHESTALGIIRRKRATRRVTRHPPTPPDTDATPIYPARTFFISMGSFSFNVREDSTISCTVLVG